LQHGLEASGLKAVLEFFWLRNAKITANLDSQMIADFVVPWNGASSVRAWMAPPGMTTTLAQQHAIMRHEM
jgi:hypothetical protein